MNPQKRILAIGLCCWLAGASAAKAQFPADWNTGGFDAQRSFWLKTDAKISPNNMQKPGFELVWKLDLDKKTGSEYLTTPPVLLDFYISYRGFRSLGFVGGRDNRVVAFDTDLGRVEWEKNFDVPKAGPAATANCPGGMTAGLTRRAIPGYPPVTTPRGFGRGTPAKSAVGEPFEGAVTLKRAPAPRPVEAPAKPRPTRPQTPVSNPFAPVIQWVYALSSDGKLHALYVSNGEEPKAALPFLPANAHARGLLVVGDHAYVATVNGCGGVENGVWALDLQSGKVNRWKSGSSIAGSLGPAMGPDGTLYAAAGGELVALAQGTLQPKGSYKLPNGEFSSSPIVFEVKDKDLLATTSSDGKLQIFDTAALATPVSTSVAFTASQTSDGGALASWQDAAGTRWLLAPSQGAASGNAGFKVTNGEVKNGAIVAWKVVEQDGKASLQPGWVSRDLSAPLTPIIVNGVVFAVSSGSATKSPAVLYALDALTGKELWNSGNTITSFVTTGGLAAGGTRVYVAAQDGTQYVFGFPIEH